MGGIPEWATERLVYAPKEALWAAWTDPSIFSRWYGPGVDTIIHRMDVVAGGECQIQLKTTEGSIYQKFEYLEIQPYQRLVWAFATTDEHWKVIRSPLIDHWPGTLISTLTLTPHKQDLMMRFTWKPYQASDQEITCFKSHKLEIDTAWRSAFSELDRVLENT